MTEPMHSSLQVVADGERELRLQAAAPLLARLLLRLEQESYASARPCPFCDADEDWTEGLPHAVECELDRALFESGARQLQVPRADGAEDVASRGHSFASLGSSSSRSTPSAS